MSMIVVRIDDRLIHGQVVEGWCRNLKINHIIVCNDSVAGDQMQKTLLSLAVPSDIKVSIHTIEETPGIISAVESTRERVLLLLSSPLDALRLVKNGFKVKEINVGGMHYAAGKIQVHRAISLGNDDLNAFEELDRLGVSLEARILPSDPKIRMN